MGRSRLRPPHPLQVSHICAHDAQAVPLTVITAHVRLLADVDVEALVPIPLSIATTQTVQIDKSGGECFCKE